MMPKGGNAIAALIAFLHTRQGKNCYSEARIIIRAVNTLIHDVQTAGHACIICFMVFLRKRQK